MKSKLVALATSVGLLVIAHGTARADVVVLTFEGLQNLEPILNYYNGGLGGFGSGPGPNYGIAFQSNSLAIISNAAGGTGNFSNNSSGNTVAFFLSGVGDVMDVTAGFTTGFSFFYSAVGSGSVSVYSGLDGTGNLLQTLSLSDTGNNGPSGGSTTTGTRSELPLVAQPNLSCLVARQILSASTTLPSGHRYLPSPAPSSARDYPVSSPRAVVFSA